ncbi:MAG TPA: hypothetical protein VGQ46_13000 [Thermoanaerobaculia bacterium]|nr:hypothetical protein [Thermoanaerobaculia bacterium]
MRMPLALFPLVLAGCLSASAPPTIQPELPVLTYCDLIADPVRYNEQVVRVRATYSSGFEHSFLSGDGCDEHRTWVDFSPSYQTNTAKRVRETFASLDTATELVAVGVFTGVAPTRVVFGRTIHDRFGHMGGYDYHFKLLAIESVTPTHPPRTKTRR